MHKKTLILLLLFLLSVALPAQAQRNQDNTINGILNRNPRFAAFAAAAGGTGLADDLAVRTRTYTVFVPTNQSIDALARSLGVSRQQLVRDRAFMRRIVQYHILGGEFTLGRTVLEEPLNVFTFSNDPMTIDFVNNQIDINRGEAFVTQPNIFADNGVIHVINTLLLPPGIDIEIAPVVSPGGEVSPQPVFPQGSVLQVASTRGDLSTFVNAVVAAGLVEGLNAPNLTVFAPTNGAFQTLLNDLGTSQQSLLQNTDLLTAVLTFHVSPQRYTSGDLAQIGLTVTGPTLNGAPLPGGSISPATIPTLNGTPLAVQTGGGVIRLDNSTATVQLPDIAATNGVIHVIDNVMLP